MDELIIKAIRKSLDNGEKLALVIITENIGSTPRKVGSIMAVFEDGRILGSIGGGKLEYEIILMAEKYIKKEKDYSFEYNLSEDGELGMICGGHVKGFIKILKPRPKLLIVGAGHIGEQLFKFAINLGFYTVIFDDREEYANREKFDLADEIIVGNIGDNLKRYNLNGDCYIVIATRGEPDIDALRAVVAKGAAYIGMIGSCRKAAVIMKRLADEGIPKEELSKVYSPIGINISSELPQDIALSIITEIMIIKNKGTLDHMKNLKGIIV